MIKAILLALALVATMVSAQACRYKNGCCTNAGMNTFQCAQVQRRWATGQCNRARLTADGIPAEVANVVVWVGPGCPTPCATKAKDLKQNPRAYCKSKNQAVSYVDGGCKIAADCRIFCRDVCTKQPFCKWRKGLCQLKTEYEITGPTDAPAAP